MVTQDAAILPKVNKMKMKKAKKKSKKKKLKGANNFDSESEADKMDLDQKVYPLSHYISDQDELVNQMFLTISGSKLEAMLPPVLKSTPLTELKRLCLHELRGMSKKRILCCINGEVMEGSSGSEDEEDDKEGAAVEDSTQNGTNTKGEKRKPGDDQAPESYLLKKIKVEPGLEDSTGSGEGKSVLELLELEMRARIIKTMLEKGDEGKKITEDAIAAVMQSAKQVTQEGADVTPGNSREATSAKTDSKDDPQRKDSDREAEGEEESMKERSRGRRRSQGKEGDRRRRYRSAGDGKRNSSRSQKRDGNNSGVARSGRSSKKQKEPSSSEKQVIKKKKITRKEFEERMKRAKKNRTYRQRKSSEDEEKTEENEDKPEEKSKEGNEEKTEDKPDAKTQDAPTEENSVQDKAGGEASEKEEGEIDSNEEEEGACSPTDISSASQYSSSSSYSRSWSRSYSRSPSRSPHRGRQRRSRRSRSRSKSRRRRRSYSQSYSRSRSPERRGRGEHKRQSYERKRSREPLKSSSKKDVKKPSPAEDRSPSREEDWGHKCDIEFVDSEEDFDDNPEATKKDAGGKKTVPLNRIERASISFSLQKKAVGIAQSVDLDDLPLKKKQMADDIEALAPPVKPSASEEIVISSDSEVELQGSTQGTKGKKQKSSKELKTDRKEQTEERPVTSTTDSRLESTEKSVVSPITKNINSQVNQQKIAKEAVDSEMKTKVVVQKQQGEITEDTSWLTADTAFEISTKNGTETMDNSNSKVESHIRGFKSVDDKETTPVASGDAPLVAEGVNRDTSPDNKQENKSESSRTDPSEAPSGRSAADSREEGGSTLCEETEPDETATEIRVFGVGDEKHLSETEITKGSPKKPKRRTEKEVNLKHFTAIHSVDEDGQTEAEASVSDETKGHRYEEIGVESKAEDTHVDSGSEKKMEKNDSSVTCEQEKADNKTIATVFGDQNEEEFCMGTEQLRFSEDEKEESEERAVKELCRKRIPVEPLRLETGLIRRRVQPSRKIEMIVPEKSWMKREKKKKEKTRDVLAMEGVGLLKSTLFEGACSSSQDREMEGETSQKTEPVETLENKEVPVHSGFSEAPVSDSENSQQLDDLVPQSLASPTSKQDTPPEASQPEDKSPRKTDHDTEIIGVIETSNHPSDNFDDMDLGGSSWSMRWLQSEKVQKVVTSSKMLSRVRKKIQKKDKATKVVMAEKVEETQKPTEPVVPVIGSIEEYERLFGTKVKKDDAAGVAGMASQGSLELVQASGDTAQTQGDMPETKDKGNPVFGSDDDGEDSEEEALWSKIIKK